MLLRQADRAPSIIYWKVRVIQQHLNVVVTYASADIDPPSEHKPIAHGLDRVSFKCVFLPCEL
jgi:hypothetical protein